MSSVDAKTYLSRRNVPALFECLMTGLMFHRPTDHIQYLIDCLEKVKLKGQEELRWNMFIEMQRAKTPLPPITPNNGRRPMSRERSMTPKEERQAASRTPTPLPPITDPRTIPAVPIIFLVGGPGCGKSTQADLLIQKHPQWVTVSIGELLRKKVDKKGAAEAKWKMVNDLMSKGEMVPEEVVESLLINKLKASPVAEGFIIQGFPRDMEQAMQFDKLVGRLDAVFLLDCEEETLSKQLLERAKDTKRIDNNVNTVAKRIQAFKDKSLPVYKHYDDMQKLFIVDGEKGIDEIAEELAIIFEAVVSGKSLSPSPSKEPKPERVRSPKSGRTTPKKHQSPEPSAPPPPEEDCSAPLPAHLMPPEVKVKDEGRLPDMPKGPIIFIAGGPGSGKGTQCKRLLSRYTNAVHLSMGDIIRTKITTEGSADEKWSMVTELVRKGDLAPEEVTVELLTKALKEKPDAHFFLVEGFPRNLEQLEDFNKQIGGQNFTILLDCEESILHYRLSMRGKESERIDDNLVAIGKKLTFFKNNTLPILKTIDDNGKLVLVDGDRDQDEIYFDLCKVLDFAIYGTLPELPKPVGGSEPVAEEVVEETIVPASGTTTGDNIANPSYTAKLDAQAPTEGQKADDTKPAESGEGTTQETPKEDSTPAADAKPEEAKPVENTEGAKPAESETAKDEEQATTEAAKTEQAEAPAKTEEAEAPAKTEEAEAPAKTEEPAAEEKPAEEAPKAEEAPQEQAGKTEEAAPADDGPKEEASKPEEAAASEEAPKTDEAPKEEAPTVEGSSEQAPAEAAPAEEAAQEVKAEESAPKAEQEENKEGDAATTDAAKEEEATAAQ